MQGRSLAAGHLVGAGEASAQDLDDEATRPRTAQRPGVHCLTILHAGRTSVPAGITDGGPATHGSASCLSEDRLTGTTDPSPAIPAAGRDDRARLPEASRGLPDDVLVRPGRGTCWSSALVVAQQGLIARISLESLRTNRHFLWMIPAADLAIFALCGVVLARLARRRPGSALSLCHRTGAGLLALGALLSVECLHPLVAVILSSAFAYKAAALLKGRSALFLAGVRKTLPVMAVVPVVFAGLTVYSVRTSERRAWSRLPASPPAAPNVLFIVLDNVRADSMSLYGYARPTTPRLADLARDGVRFDSARSTAPWTLPSHASMFTGQWPHRLSVDWMTGLDGTYPTLAEFLAGQGYATAGFVANTYYCNARYGLDRGFARYEDFRENQIVSLFEVVRSTEPGEVPAAADGVLDELRPRRYRFAEDRGHDQSRCPRVDLEPPGRPAVLPVPQLLRRPCPVHPARGRDPAFRPLPPARDEQVEIMKKADQAGRAGPAVSDEERARLDQQANAIRQDGYESSIAYLDEQIGRLFDELAEPGAAREHAGDRDLRPRRALPGARVLRARHERLPARDPRAAPDLPPADHPGPAHRPRTREPARPARHGRRSPRPGRVLAVPGPIARPLLPRRRRRSDRRSTRCSPRSATIRT